MRKHFFYLCLILAPLLSSIGYSQAIKVEVIENNGTFQLFRNGKSYYVHGAGGKSYLDRLKNYGGNSIRTWSAENAKAILDEAQKNGLTVMMGLWVQHERHGFDYNNAEKVAAQLAKFRKTVNELKDHPALLLWGIGNEMDLFYSNTNVWYAVQDIAKMIHETDPNHPTATVTAGLDSLEVALINERCPDVDIYCVNTYGDLPTVPIKIREAGWKGPYMITEWGPNGHWEVAKTSWDASFEQTSSEKAASYRERHQIILNDSTKCLGSYVFLWGNKQERTATWYGLFLKSGEESQVMDMLQLGWSGKLPQNEAPHISPLKLNNKTAPLSISLRENEPCNAHVTCTDPDNDNLMYEWEVRHESSSTKSGGDQEAIPPLVKGVTVKQTKNQASFNAPSQSGTYRLFVYVYDGHNNVATGNIPFKVE